MAEIDLYHVLGVERGTSEDAIRSAYRKLARQYHPDVNPNDPKAEERFKEISFAYEVLSDPEKRRLYDEFGHEGLASGFDPDQARAYRRWAMGAQRSPSSGEFFGSIDFDDLLSQLFGRGARTRRGPRRGSDAEGEITVDFMDAVLGREVRVQLAGRGALRVRVPEGADEGTRIRLGGQGAAGSHGGAAGDLYLTLHVRPHRFFRREGADLHLDLPVTMLELVEGATVDVPTPHGPVKMAIPPGSRNDSRLRLRGKGVKRRGGSGRGDLLVRLVLKLPETRDERLREIARELEPLYGGTDLRQGLREHA
ncbi:MAG: DnaJ C-terminal domain-containing protein [Myxococcota bacterium]